MKDDQALDKFFSEIRSSDPYIDDDGFTLGVLNSLPAARELPLWIKNSILMLATLLGTAMAAWQLPVMELISSIATASVSIPMLIAIVAATYAMSFIVYLATHYGTQ